MRNEKSLQSREAKENIMEVLTTLLVKGVCFYVILSCGRVGNRFRKAGERHATT